MDEQIGNTISYFRNLWQTNITDLQNQCDTWEKICVNDSIPDEVHGDIRTNIGLAKLLMNQKLKQFKGLIDDSEFNTGEKEITCLDLQGFWDMVYNEVVKIKNCFIRLEKCKNNEWKFDDMDSNKPKKKVPVKREIMVSKEKVDVSSKSHALAAKQRLAEVKKRMLALNEQKKKQNFVEITEFNSNGFNHAETVNSDDKGKFLGTTNMPVTNESAESLKQDLLVNEEPISSTKTTDKVETVAFNKEIKCKAHLQKGLIPSIQNKENFMPDDSSIKYNSKIQTKSREKTEVSSTKKRGKQVKDYGKLQCVTRSAKKALYLHNVPQSS